MLSEDTYTYISPIFVIHLCICFAFSCVSLLWPVLLYFECFFLSFCYSTNLLLQRLFLFAKVAERFPFTCRAWFPISMRSSVKRD